jgi:exodeoxyribonuclease X
MVQMSDRFIRSYKETEMTRAICIDFESTNQDPKLAHPVEVALYSDILSFESLIFCEDIPAETSAVHHIIADDVFNSPTWENMKATLQLHISSDPQTILVAHNAEYEKTILGEFCPVEWICTYKCAVRVWPEAPNYKNETLRYWLGLGERGRNVHQQTHSAMHDCVVTWLVFNKLLEIVSLEQMIEWTKLPIKFTKIPFGKHKGQTWDTVPGPYLDWIMKQADMSVDIKYCVQEELTKRKSNYATHRSG